MSVPSVCKMNILHHHYTIIVDIGIVKFWFNMIVKQTWDSEPEVQS